MKKPQKSSKLKGVLISLCILAILSSAILYYSNGMGNRLGILSPDLDKKGINTETEKKNEKELIISELNDLKKTYDELILDNKTISLELIQERDKVTQLMSDLVVLKDSEFSLLKYENQVKELQDKLKLMSVENEELKEQNVSIKKQNGVIKEQRDNAEVVLKESQKQSEVLKNDLLTAVEKGSKLTVSGTTVIAYKLKTSGDLIITEKANKVDGINISFIIAKNEMAKPINKVYYIQVVNSENVVLGNINEGVHKYKSLSYSLVANVNYEKKLVRVSENLLGNKFEKGTYYINVYDKEELVDESTLILK